MRVRGQGPLNFIIITSLIVNTNVKCLKEGLQIKLMTFHIFILTFLRQLQHLKYILFSPLKTHSRMRVRGEKLKLGVVLSPYMHSPMRVWGEN